MELSRTLVFGEWRQHKGFFLFFYFFSKLQYIYIYIYILKFWDIKREKGRFVVLFRERAAGYALDEIL